MHVFAQRRQRRCALGLVVFLFLLFHLIREVSAADAERSFGELERRLERLRARWNVPGMSAGVAINNKIVWLKEFGVADLETKEPVTAETVFHLASLTKPFASAALLQLAEAGQLDLEAPASSFGIDLPATGVIRVRHLLTHTSEGIPGEVFRYSGNRFAELDKVLRGITQRSFAQLLDERILRVLDLTNTAPNPLNAAACAEANRDASVFLGRSARGYAFDGRTAAEYPKHFVTAAGIVSTPGDVLKFAIALDQNVLLKAETKARAFTPARSAKGKELPYGLGWFVQRHKGATLVWHYGWDRANSSLIIKVPERELNFVLLGNSEALSRKFDLGQDEKVTRSPFAKEFLREFDL